jgi:hypothetical protein
LQRRGEPAGSRSYFSEARATNSSIGLNSAISSAASESSRARWVIATFIGRRSLLTGTSAIDSSMHRRLSPAKRLKHEESSRLAASEPGSISSTIRSAVAS